MADGDGSSRNFRSAYYEKLGFCGNEEKNILDLLIASSPFDLEKLNDLCDRFDLDRRCVEAWKVFLGVECGRKNPFDEFANVKRVRAEHFQLLKHHLEVLLRYNLVMSERLKKNCSNPTEQPNKQVNDCQPQKQHLDEKCNSNQSQNEERCNSNVFIDQNRSSADERAQEATSNSGDCNSAESSTIGLEHGQKDNILEDIESNPGKLITLMYLLEGGRLEATDINTQLDSTYCCKLSAMASFFVNVSSDLQEAFFLFRNFTKVAQNLDDSRH